MTDFRHSGYPVAAMTKACELRAAGWQYARIQRIVNDEFGLAVSHTTVRRWTNPDYAEMSRRGHRNRAALRRANESNFAIYGTTPEYRLAFMRRLCREGLGCAAIAKVCSVVFATHLTDHQVRYALKGRGGRETGTAAA